MSGLSKTTAWGCCSLALSTQVQPLVQPPRWQLLALLCVQGQQQRVVLHCCQAQQVGVRQPRAAHAWPCRVRASYVKQGFRNDFCILGWAQANVVGKPPEGVNHIVEMCVEADPLPPTPSSAPGATRAPDAAWDSDDYAVQLPQNSM